MSEIIGTGSEFAELGHFWGDLQKNDVVHEKYIRKVNSKQRPRIIHDGRCTLHRA